MKTPKTLLTTLLSATLAFAPISASANTIATPTSSTISFPMPNTKDVAKKIAKVGRVTAVSFAVEKLFDGIDWVMDPANNSIQYKQKQTDGKKCSASAYDHATKKLINLTGTNQEVATAWCKYSRPYHNPPEGMRQISNYQYHSSCKAGEAGVIISCELPTVHVPLEQIAEQIIKNALQGHPESVKFLREIAEEHKAKPPAPTQLDWGLSFKPTKPANPPVTTTPPKPVSSPQPVEPIAAAKGNEARSNIVRAWEISDDRDTNGKRPDKCTWLANNRHLFSADDVKATEKAWGCRHSRIKKDKKGKR